MLWLSPPPAVGNFGDPAPKANGAICSNYTANEQNPKGEPIFETGIVFWWHRSIATFPVSRKGAHERINTEKKALGRYRIRGEEVTSPVAPI